MELPDGWEFFYEDVCKKIKTLTSCGIWSTDSSTILAWLGNFEEDEHRYIAAHILDRITFRTEKMVAGGYKSFLLSRFREFVNEFIPIQEYNIHDWLEILQSHPKERLESINLCSVSKSGDNGDSGSHIVRILTGELVNQNRTISPEAVRLDQLDKKIILIVDDFVGSGKQFKDFAKETGLRKAATNNHIIYVPAIAFYKGLNSIREMNYGIEIFPLEIINKNEQFFVREKDCMFCGDTLNKETEVLKAYNEMMKLDPLFKKKEWLGRDKASLCVMFQWGCPNQSLGVMWYKGSKQWNRLAQRRGAP